MKDFLRNLLILIVIGIVLFAMFPNTMAQIIQIYGGLFGPLALLILFAAAIPRKRRK